MSLKLVLFWVIAVCLCPPSVTVLSGRLIVSRVAGGLLARGATGHVAWMRTRRIRRRAGGVRILARAAAANGLADVEAGSVGRADICVLVDADGATPVAVAESCRGRGPPRKAPRSGDSFPRTNGLPSGGKPTTLPVRLTTSVVGCSRNSAWRLLDSGACRWPRALAVG